MDMRLDQHRGLPKDVLSVERMLTARERDPRHQRIERPAASGLQGLRLNVNESRHVTPYCAPTRLWDLWNKNRAADSSWLRKAELDVAGLWTGYSDHTAD